MNGLGFLPACAIAIVLWVAPPSSLAGGPALGDVQPRGGPVGADVPVVLYGSGFAPGSSVALLDGGPSVLGSFADVGVARAVAFRAPLAIVADEERGLLILDLSDKSSPRLVARLALPGRPTAVELIEGHAVVACGTEGLQIVDIASPGKPELVASLPLEGETLALAVQGESAFVVVAGVGLQVIDLSRPRQPQVIAGCADCGSGNMIAVEGEVLYLGSASTRTSLEGPQDAIGGEPTPRESEHAGMTPRGEDPPVEYLSIVKVVDPASPELLSRVTTQPVAGLAVRGSTVFVLDRGLSILDASDPYAPQWIGWLKLPAGGEGIMVSGRTAFAGQGANGLATIDISDPTAPRLVSVASFPGALRQLEPADGFAVAATGPAGVLTLDLAQPASPSPAWIPAWEHGGCGPLGWHNTLSVAATRELAVFGRGINCGSRMTSGYLTAVDVSDLDSPIVLSSYWVSWAVEDIAVHAAWAYLASARGGLLIFDLSDPLEPRLASHLPLPGYARGVAVRETLAFIADGEGGLQVADVRDPKQPAPLGACLVPGEALEVALVGDWAYVAAGGDGLILVDISDPSRPEPRQQIVTPGPAQDLVIDGELAFVASGAAGLLVLDISDPTAPRELSRYQTAASATAVDVDSGRAYVGRGDGGLEVIDVRDPAAPRLGGFHFWTGPAVDIALTDDAVVIANEGGGTTVWRRNPMLRDVAVSDTEIVATIPAGHGVGPYHVRVEGLDGQSDFLPNGYEVEGECESWSSAARRPCRVETRRFGRDSPRPARRPAAR